jgi:hypothetical protein
LHALVVSSAKPARIDANDRVTAVHPLANRRAAAAQPENIKILLQPGTN